MLRALSSSVCPFCEAQWLSRATKPAWQPLRDASTLQKHRPSRMVLSGRVAQGPPKQVADGAGRVVRKSRNSPFGGMNVTEPPRALQIPRNKISAAERKRQTRMAPTKTRKDEAPKEPMKALKMQRALVHLSYDKRGRVKQDLQERASFKELGLLPTIEASVAMQALGGLVDAAPTPIQRLAIPALLGTPGPRKRRHRKGDGLGGKEMEPFLLAAETGSGKTLAYVLPIIDAIKRAEAADVSEAAKDAEKKITTGRTRMFEIDGPDVDATHPTTGRPRAIILLPTSELVSQVGAVLKSLSHTVKFRAAMISAAFTGTVIRNRLFSPSGVDVVVATPHLLNSIAESDANILSRVSHLVIDEADSLLDRSFSPITSSIIDRAAPSLEQLIMCSATIPRSLDSYLNKRYPETQRLATPNLHAIPRRVQLSVVDIEKVPYQGNRDLACAQTIWNIGKDVPELGEDKMQKVVVFVNEREKAGELATSLRARGIDATALSRDSDERKQAETLAPFTGAIVPASSRSTDIKSSDPLDRAADPPKRRLPNTKVLVMTDIGSRGIDTLLVKHVILYDVPHTSIDFIHRLGRVGRMGRRGRGIVLVGRHDRKDIVKEVREGMFKGQALI